MGVLRGAVFTEIHCKLHQKLLGNQKLLREINRKLKNPRRNNAKHRTVRKKGVVLSVVLGKLHLNYT